MRWILVGIAILLSLKLSAQPINNDIILTEDTVNKKKLTRVIITEAASYAAGLSFLHFIWYKDKERVRFNFYDDSKGYLQIDKWGHAYTAYRQSFAAYSALRSAGVSKKKALIYGGPMGLIFQTPI